MALAGGNKLQTTVKMDETRAEVKVDPSKAAATSMGPQDPKADISDPLTNSALAALQSDVQPVGHDYVEEVRFLNRLQKCVQILRLTYETSSRFEMTKAKSSASIANCVNVVSTTQTQKRCI